MDGETVHAFNALPRKETVPTGPGPNHWHFSIRSVGEPFNPRDIVYLISPANHLMHVAPPPKGTPILSLPISPRVDLAASLLLRSFVEGVLKADKAHHDKFVPWSWSCNDAALSRLMEEKFRKLGVRGELCAVKLGSEEENKLSDDIWNMMKGTIRTNFKG